MRADLRERKSSWPIGHGCDRRVKRARIVRDHDASRLVNRGALEKRRLTELERDVLEGNPGTQAYLKIGAMAIADAHP